MGIELLMLRLEGPVQSWSCGMAGSVATQDYPPKSAIVQILARVHGYAAGDPRIAESFERGLRFGVRIEVPGRVLHYEAPAADSARRPHAARTPAASHKIDPAQGEFQHYIQDAAFLVALQRTPDAAIDLLSWCAAALVHPAMPVYLGRRSCAPTRPLFERLTTSYLDIVDALTKYPWVQSDTARSQTSSQDLIAYVEPDIAPDRGRRSGSGAAGADQRCLRRLVVPFAGLDDNRPGRS